MTHWTPEAARRLDEYLSNVRHALANAHDLNADEIESDIRSHIDAEFHSAIRPVTLTELESVLVRLGPPEAWVSSAGEAKIIEGETFRWTGLIAKLKQNLRNVIGTLWNGPEDWRLPYLAFGSFALGILFLPLFGFGLFVLGLSYFLGRATIDLAREKGVALGARRWLAFPGIVAISFMFLLLIVSWPIVAAPTMLDIVRAEQYQQRNHRDKQGDIFGSGLDRNGERIDTSSRLLSIIPAKGENAQAVAALYAAIGAFSAWWTLLGLWMYAKPAWPKAMFFPLLNYCESRHGMRLAGTMGLIFIVWLGVLFRFAGASS